MKARALDLLIVDDNKQIVNSLSKFLNQKFGIRINISQFFDEDSCVQKIDERSHVIVLDYFMNGEGKKTKNGLEIFNSIKKRSPQAQVTMITSNEGISEAVEEMKRGTSDYIIKRERYLRKVLRLLHKTVVHPITQRVVIPIRKIIKDYTLGDYLKMFVVAFASVGTLVYLALKISR